jgi:hypothetical protein
MLGGGVVNSDSNLSTFDDKKVLGSITEDGDNDSEGMFMATGKLGYVTSSGTDFYLSSEGDLTLGVAHDFEFGSLRSELLYRSGEVWENPYLTGVKRKETDVDEFGVRLGLSEIMGTGLEFDYTFTDVSVDDDTVGDLYEALDRSGSRHEINVAYSLPFAGSHALIPGVTYEKGDMDGDAESYDRYALNLGYRYTDKCFLFDTTLSAGVVEYDDTHPLYSKTRDDSIYSIESRLTWLKPFGYDNYSVSVTSGYTHHDSNIDFFDSNESMVGFGIGYSF